MPTGTFILCIEVKTFIYKDLSMEDLKKKLLESGVYVKFSFFRKPSLIKGSRSTIIFLSLNQVLFAFFNLNMPISFKLMNYVVTTSLQR